MTQSTKPYIDVPTWRNGTWETTGFGTREEFRDFVTPLFKEPGKYDFNDTSYVFNEQSRLFIQKGHYCSAPRRTLDYDKYWFAQKDRSRFGTLFISGDKKWYLPREYYFWLNFLQINDKRKNKFDFPEVMDVQYHMALYELLAELHYKHAPVLKKRQIASSYYHVAKLTNYIWFEEGFKGKIGASLKSYIDASGSWKFFDEYRSFLNKNTAWYRPMNPGKPLLWEQKIEVTDANGRKYDEGLKGEIKGTSFEQDAATGVGGPCRIFFYEEGGIAPTADETYGYIKPAMRFGQITTGIFIIAGSVGDLEQCEPLKKFIMNPEGNGMYAVETNLLDEKGTIGKTGLFLPEQWSMPPFIDEFGNSDVEGALAALNAEFEELKKKLDPEDYQLEVSQRPRNIAEAFAYRKESKFPIHLLSRQEKRIEEKEYPYMLVNLFRDATGKLQWKETNKLPISQFPIDKKAEDKEGSIVVWERPVENPEFGMYYASIDPVSEGKTTTSESLCSIYIMKNAVEVTRENADGSMETFIEQDKIVAAWCGRFNDINKTHERLELMLEWYNAWAVVENNVSLFIQYMISKRKQKYLVPKNQIMFLKDLGANTNVFQEYGWKNVGTLFKNHLLSYGIEYLTEELDVETKEDGEIVRITFGVERIPDPMLIKEMKAYNDDVNVDRLVSFVALVAFMKIQQANRGYSKRLERNENLHKSEKIVKLDRSPFRHMGKSTSSGLGKRPPRGPFKNLK